MPPTSPQTEPADSAGTQITSLIDAHQPAAACEAQRTPDVGAFLRSGGMPELCQALKVDLDARHEAWLRKQYLRDLEVIERCQCQITEAAGCPDFFGYMGAIAAARGAA